MSATGKSTVLRQLAARGHHTVDVDDEGWFDDVPTDGGSDVEQLWHEERMATLLADEPEGLLFVAGCAGNQGRFYDRFEAVVLLSVPLDVLLERLATRDTNPFGKSPAERERILRDLTEVEPLLRRTATAEIDTDRPLTEVVDAIEELARLCG
jgi:shikimate kinase